MDEPTIICPQCHTEIKLTESLAAPIVEATRKDFEKRLSEKEKEYSAKDKNLKEKEEFLAKEKESIEESIGERVRTEKERIAKEESEKAKRFVSLELEKKNSEILEFQELLKNREEKLQEAQNAQVEILKKERELAEKSREIDLTIEKRVINELDATREKAKKEAEESLNLKLREREEVISSMQKQIEELKRKSEQGSQQLQGEVQELELENLLHTKFPGDTIEPVPKGEFGGDVLQRIINSIGQPSGTILWESKRTKNWSDNWLSKLREDQRTAKAEISVLVSHVLPKGVETFDLVEGVWITHPRSVIPVATILRQSLMEIASVRQSADGQQTKTEMIYQYLTGPRFRQRVEAIVEAFSTMQEDLDKEKKVIMKQWSKRSEQIERVIGSTVGMYGDLQGIAGKSLQEIEGLSLNMLDQSE